MDRGDHASKGSSSRNWISSIRNTTPRSCSSAASPSGDQHVRQVLPQVAAVGPTAERLEIEAAGHGPLGRDREREGLQDASRPASALAPALLRRDLEERSLGEVSHAVGEPGRPGDLGLDRYPSFGQRAFLECPEQHRLAHTSKARDHHRLLSAATKQSCEKNVERDELLIAADERRRPRAGVRGVRVQPRVHPTDTLPMFSEVLKS